MNAKFIRQHLRSGKSRMRPSWRYPESAWFGAPKSGQFVRCYPKPPVKGFRVEVQFNRGAIQKHGLDDLEAWTSLPELMEKRVVFCRMDWNRLAVYVRRHRRHPDAVLDRARELRGNLNGLLRFLRQIGVNNPQRFLVPLPLNEEIAEALARWRRKWDRDGRG